MQKSERAFSQSERATSMRRRPAWAERARALSAIVALGLVLVGSLPGRANADPAPASPSQLFGALYAEVEVSGLFPDSKTFADAVARREPEQILSDYRSGMSRSELHAFVLQNFVLPVDTEGALPAAEPDIAAHIASLWPVLARAPLTAEPNSSHLSLAYPYLVPGGRFREVYYWDSYFSMLGLIRDERMDIAQGLVANFADLIERYGHVPNGARTYYLSRSQPPVFFLMIGLTSEDDPAAGYARYLPALRREYAFWMAGEDSVRPGQGVQHVVQLDDGSILNRYWDAAETPRDESYREDVALAAMSGRPAAELYREIRSSAESGWDFSSRWMADEASLASLQTTSIAPVDLNSLLFGMERAIAAGCERAGDRVCAREYAARAARRRRTIERHLWDPVRAHYLDLNWRTGQRLDRPSAAMLYPLFVGAASRAHGRATAATVRTLLLAPGGLRTTTVRTGQQWDAPNGWAPLQWIAVSGLRRYGEAALARTVATRWLSSVCRTYRETGKLLEKYDVEEVRPGGGGEYPLQDGFGWTNGVTRAFLGDYAATPAARNCARR